MKKKIIRKPTHNHTWIVTAIAISAALAMLFLMPREKGYSLVFVGIAGGHLVLALMAVYFGWLITPQELLSKIWKKKPLHGYDYGWSYKWTYGFLFASVIMLFFAVHIYFTLSTSPFLQISVYTILLLLAVNLFVGNAIIRNSGREEQITLPMVNLLPNGGRNILDAGCGAGRTSIALARVFPGIHITAFDRFDAEYIDDGGMALLKHNLKLAEIDNKVSIVTGDITQTPFANNQFDAIVSSFMFDHLRTGKKQALNESYRILKPGGRFLLIILVRGYVAFGVASLMSLLITPRKKWKTWIEEAGFKIISEGNINEGAYFLFEK